MPPHIASTTRTCDLIRTSQPLDSGTQHRLIFNFPPSLHSSHSYPFPTLALADVHSNSFLFVSVCALHTAYRTLTRARPAAQPPHRSATVPPNFDHFNTSQRWLGPPPAAISSLHLSRRGARPNLSRSDLSPSSASGSSHHKYDLNYSVL